MTEAQHRLESRAALEERAAGINAQAGPVIERRIGKVSWTKDPAAAPAPGDITSDDDSLTGMLSLPVVLKKLS